MPVLALLWTWYPLTAGALVVAASIVTRDPALRTGRFLALHALILAAAGALHYVMRTRTRLAQRLAWSLFNFVGLPTVFSAIGLVLPMVNPQPWEWWCIGVDRLLTGTDPIPALGSTLAPWSTEILQACYAVFYLIPVAALLGVAAHRKGAEFDHGLATVAFGFQLSYLGYFVWPTLGPNRLGLWERPVEGMFLAEKLHELIETAEANHWDCFPSGHTMLSLVGLWIAFQGSRKVAWALVPIVGCVIYATVALRYHYLADVVAGAVGAVATVVLAKQLRTPARTAVQR